ncbi:MAG: hypothetical protein CMJ83_13920 [Planctomycetes bacterium]|nr:hypothetical protein [Planctomycetota bacterium]
MVRVLIALALATGVTCAQTPVGFRVRALEVNTPQALKGVRGLAEVIRRGRRRERTYVTSVAMDALTSERDVVLPVGRYQVRFSYPGHVTTEVDFSLIGDSDRVEVVGREVVVRGVLLVGRLRDGSDRPVPAGTPVRLEMVNLGFPGRFGPNWRARRVRAFADATGHWRYGIRSGTWIAAKALPIGNDQVDEEGPPVVWPHRITRLHTTQDLGVRRLDRLGPRPARRVLLSESNGSFVEGRYLYVTYVPKGRTDPTVLWRVDQLDGPFVFLCDFDEVVSGGGSLSVLWNPRRWTVDSSRLTGDPIVFRSPGPITVRGCLNVPMAPMIRHISRVILEEPGFAIRRFAPIDPQTGEFTFTNTAPGCCRLRVPFRGHDLFFVEFEVRGGVATQDLGTISFANLDVRMHALQPGELTQVSLERAQGGQSNDRGFTYLTEVKGRRVRVAIPKGWTAAKWRLVVTTANGPTRYDISKLPLERRCGLAFDLARIVHLRALKWLDVTVVVRAPDHSWLEGYRRPLATAPEAGSLRFDLRSGTWNIGLELRHREHGGMLGVELGAAKVLAAGDPTPFAPTDDAMKRVAAKIAELR